MQIDCFPLPIPCFYTVYAEGRNKPFVVTETSAAFYLSPVNPPDQQATNVDIKRAWCATRARAPSHSQLRAERRGWGSRWLDSMRTRAPPDTPGGRLKARGLRLGCCGTMRTHARPDLPGRGLRDEAEANRA